MSRKHAGGWEVVKLKYSGPQREEEESDLSEVEEDACSSSESEDDSVRGTLIDSDLEDYEGVAPQTAEGDGVREGQFGVGVSEEGLGEVGASDTADEGKEMEVSAEGARMAYFEHVGQTLSRCSNFWELQECARPRLGEVEQFSIPVTFNISN